MSQEKKKEESESETKRPSRVDPNFKHEVLKMHGGETLKICFQCGTCTSGCTIANFTDSYRPRQIIRLAQLGLSERLLPSDTLWLCSACYTCTDKCPQGVEVRDVIRVLQNIAVQKGYIPKAYREFAKNIVKSGYAYNIPSFRLKKRGEVGLPPIPTTNTKEIEKLAEITGLKDQIEKEEKA